MRHEHDPKYSGLEEIRARREEFAKKLAEMSVIPCDADAEPMESHPVIHFPKARRHDQAYEDVALLGEW